MKQRSPYVIEVVEEFLRTKAARERATRASYDSIFLGSERGTRKPLGQPFAVYFRNRKFGSLSPDDVATWFAQRVESGSQNTKHRISKAVRHFLAWANRRGYASGDLASAVEPYRQGQGRIDSLGWAEVDHLLAAIPELNLRFAVAWLFFTGCRIGEAVRARQADVRWREDFGMYEWTIPAKTKTHNARTVWLPERLGRMLEETRQLNKPQPNWPILWDCEGRGYGRHESPAATITPRTINNALGRARERIGLTIPLTAHVCKHTYCTNWIREQGQGEFAMEKLSRLVGTSVANLRKTYVHLNLTASDWADLKTFGETRSMPKSASAS